MRGGTVRLAGAVRADLEIVLAKSNVLLGALLAVAGASSAIAQAPAAPVEAPRSIAVAKMLAAALETICTPYLATAGAAGESLTAAASAAGFEPGAPDPGGAVGAPIPGAAPPTTFHAAEGSDGTAGGVELYLDSTPRACQLRVKNDAGAWTSFTDRMVRRGARLVTAAELAPGTKYSHEVYVGGMKGLPGGYTVFASRWVGSGPPPKGMWALVNVLPDTGAGG